MFVLKKKKKKKLFFHFLCKLQVGVGKTGINWYYTAGIYGYRRTLHAWQFAETAMLMRKGNNRENLRLRAREQDSGGGVDFFL